MLFKLGGVGLSDASEANIISRNFRKICGLIDTAVFVLLRIMYIIFFNVATADIFSTESILELYKRFQLIIGVFMVFQLTLIIIKGMFNVEEVGGSKSNEFIKRIIISLTMLTLLTPISIPNASNEFEKRVNNNGLLFGTLYSLQWRVLNTNTIGRLVLGSSSTETDGENEFIEDSANSFTNTIIKSMIRINLKSENLEETDDTPLETDPENRMCKVNEDDLDVYLSENSTPSQLFDLVDTYCKVDGKKRFTFTYLIIISFIVGVIFAILLASFTVDVAIRSVKLIVLRIVAPIPIIAYINPKGGNDSGFNSWLKTLIQTYVEIFIRLAVIYFVIYVIQDIIRNGIIINTTGGLIGAISVVFIFIGLLLFAKEAPKFLQNAMGLKSEPGSLFGKALGRAAATFGTVGAAKTAWSSSKRSSDNIELMNGKPYNSAQKLLNRGKQVVAGITGGITGLGTGMNAVQNAKGDFVKAGREAQMSQIDRDIARGSSGSTFFGRLGASLGKTFVGDTRYNKDTRKIALNKARAQAAGDLYSYAVGKAERDESSTRVSTKHADGTMVVGSLDEFHRAAAEARSKETRGEGNGSFEFGGKIFNINDGYYNKFETNLKESAGTKWLENEIAKGAENMDKGAKQKLDLLYETVPKDKNAPGPERAGVMQEQKDGNIVGHLTDLRKYEKASDGAAKTEEADGKYQRRKANMQEQNKK